MARIRITISTQTVAVLLIWQLSSCLGAVLSSSGHHDIIRSERSLQPLLGGSAAIACTDLTNKGTHFTVDIEVGTPGQRFSVVADTGSNSLIVPSCECVRSMSCSSKDRCFTGTNKSSSFVLEKNEKGFPEFIQLTFGSGSIQAVLAKEVVNVANMSVHMNDGILLMTDKMLRIGGSFEGILGLGLPNASAAMHDAEEKAAASREDMLKKIMEKYAGGSAARTIGDVNNNTDKEDILKKIFGGVAGRNGFGTTSAVNINIDDIVDRLRAGAQPATAVLERERMGLHYPETFEEEDSTAFLQGPIKHSKSVSSVNPTADFHRSKINPAPEGLLEQAGIERFSMCFNDGSDGVLKIGTPPVQQSLGNVGRLHWSLELEGLTIGNQTAMLNFCSKKNMTKGQLSACAAIPDSGTTVIMGPQDQLSIMLESICDNWDRCRENHTHLVTAAKKAKEAAVTEYGIDPFDHSLPSKASVLSLVLMDCGSWLTDSKGLDELPPLHFHVAGSDGKKQSLKLPGWAYILESTSSNANETYKHLEGLLQEGTLRNASKYKKVCSPAFGAMSYSTSDSGPIWILGTPLFYEFHVGYDLKSEPPSMSFVSTHEQPCTSCSAKTSLLSQQGSSERRRPRWVSGPLRLPNINFDQPL